MPERAGAERFRYTLTECSGVFRQGPPKSRSGIRSLRLPEVAVDALKDHQKIQEDAGLANSEVVFCDSEGGLLRKSNFIQRVYKPLLERIDLKGFRFHDLRHTAATLLLARGVHPKLSSHVWDTLRSA